MKKIIASLLFLFCCCEAKKSLANRHYKSLCPDFNYVEGDIATSEVILFGETHDRHEKTFACVKAMMQYHSKTPFTTLTEGFEGIAGDDNTRNRLCYGVGETCAGWESNDLLEKGDQLHSLYYTHQAIGHYFRLQKESFINIESRLKYYKTMQDNQGGNEFSKKESEAGIHFAALSKIQKEKNKHGSYPKAFAALFKQFKSSIVPSDGIESYDDLTLENLKRLESKTRAMINDLHEARDVYLLQTILRFEGIKAVIGGRNHFQATQYDNRPNGLVRDTLKKLKIPYTLFMMPEIDPSKHGRHWVGPADAENNRIQLNL